MNRTKHTIGLFIVTLAYGIPQKDVVCSHKFPWLPPPSKMSGSVPTSALLMLAPCCSQLLQHFCILPHKFDQHKSDEQEGIKG